MSESMIDPRLPFDPPIDLRAHPRILESDVRQRLCPAVIVVLTDQAARAKAKRRVNPPATGKVCSVCQTWKPWAEYYLDHLQSNGHRTYCKSCCAAFAAFTNRGKPLVVASVRERLAARRAAERERG